MCYITYHINLISQRYWYDFTRLTEKKNTMLLQFVLICCQLWRQSVCELCLSAHPCAAINVILCIMALTQMKPHTDKAQKYRQNVCTSHKIKSNEVKVKAFVSESLLH